jgi:hypothetical protein
MPKVYGEPFFVRLLHDHAEVPKRPPGAAVERFVRCAHAA